MRLKRLRRHGIHVVEGHKNGFDADTNTHWRSYICAVMPKKLFYDKIESHLHGLGVKYLTQCNEPLEWNLEDIGGVNGRECLLKRKRKCELFLELLDDIIEIRDDEVYVVMWNSRFLPRCFTQARALDMDTILLDILETRSWPFWTRFVSACFGVH